MTDEYFNNVVLNPSPDLIQEVKIDKTDYDAEFGGKSGGVINVITKSGTNHFHGSLYEFVRNNVFDARNFFRSRQPACSALSARISSAERWEVRSQRTRHFSSSIMMVRESEILSPTYSAFRRLPSAQEIFRPCPRHHRAAHRSSHQAAHPRQQSQS